MTCRPCLAQIDNETGYAIQVERSSHDAMQHERQLVLKLTNGGKVASVSPSSPQLFGFEPSLLVGQTLDGIIDVFAEWKASGALRSLPHVV